MAVAQLEHTHPPCGSRRLKPYPHADYQQAQTRREFYRFVRQCTVVEHCDVLEFQKTIAFHPTFVEAHLLLSGMYLLKGERAKADEAIRKGSEVHGGELTAEQLVFKLPLLGKNQKMMKAVEQLKRSASSQSYFSWGIAQYYAAIGDRDQAFEWLEKAYEARLGNLNALKVGPFFDPIRSDPRFPDLMRRVGLKP